MSEKIIEIIKNDLTEPQEDEIEFLCKHFKGELTPSFCCGMSILKI